MSVSQRRLQPGYSLGQHAPKHICGRPHLLVLQHVDQVAQAAFIAAIRYRFDEWRLRAPAQPTACFPVLPAESVRADQVFATDRAQSASDGVNGGETGCANRKT